MASRRACQLALRRGDPVASAMGIEATLSMA
jgi:hypothetical protein